MIINENEDFADLLLMIANKIETLDKPISEQTKAKIKSLAEDVLEQGKKQIKHEHNFLEKKELPSAKASREYVQNNLDKFKLKGDSYLDIDNLILSMKNEDIDDDEFSVIGPEEKKAILAMDYEIENGEGKNLKKDKKENESIEK